jgi:hypothetical protein
LGEVAQGNEQNSGLVFIFQCSFEVLGGKIRVFPEPSNDGLVVRASRLSMTLRTNPKKFCPIPRNNR